MDTDWFANAIICETDERKTKETPQITVNEDINTEMSDFNDSNKNDKDNIKITDKYEEVTDDDYEILGPVDRDTLLQDAADYIKALHLPLYKEKCPKVYFVMMMQSI